MKEQEIETKTLHRCDCTHFHEAAEMKTITLKIRIGKDCSLDQAIANMFPGANVKENASVAATSEASKVATISTPNGTITVNAGPKLGEQPKPIQPVVDPDSDLNNPKATHIKIMTPEEKAKFLKESAAIPAEFLRRITGGRVDPGVGIPSHDAQFESKGAKVIRVAA